MVIKKFMVIIGCFIFCVMFYIIIIFFVLDYKFFVGKRIYMIIVVMLFVNSVINFIFYVWCF